MTKQLSDGLITIPKTVLTVWKKKRSRGDLSQLVLFTQFSKPTISKAINHGKANQAVIIKISQYFSKKSEYTSKEIEIEALKILGHEQ